MNDLLDNVPIYHKQTEIFILNETCSVSGELWEHICQDVKKSICTLFLELAL